jgi:hypothetical protein
MESFASVSANKKVKHCSFSITYIVSTSSFHIRYPQMANYLEIFILFNTSNYHQKKGRI